MLHSHPLGKKAARTGAITFKLSKYVDVAALPPVPKRFGHEDLIGKSSWKMLGNDEYGDCVFAGAAHETMLWNREGHHSVSFTNASVLSDYSAVTGFDPSNPDTDQGTDMEEAAQYRRKVGILDSRGRRHKVAAYLSIEPGNMAEHFAAMYLFGAVGIGIEFPASAMDQFNAGRPFDIVSGSPIEGGHYLPLVARRSYIMAVTWARLHPMTTRFFRKYNDESIAYVSEEALIRNKSPEGFDAATLLADLQALKKS